MGPATAAVLADASFGADDVRAKAVSFRMLTDAGVNPGVAARIRREHSLAWSFESEGEDLGRRSSQIRGLGDAERAWVAASSGDWQERSPRDDDAAGDADGGGDRAAAVAADGADAAAERAWVADAESGGPDGTKADGSGDPAAAESAWRERSRPTPVGDVEGVTESEAADLAEAGITSARALALANAEEVADALDRDADRVAALRDAAAEYLD